MSLRNVVIPILVAILAAACALGPPARALEVTWEDGGRRAPRIGAIHVRGLSDLEAEDLWLIRGKLNDKALLGLLEFSPAEAVMERRVPTFVRVRGGEVTVLPTVRLEPAEIYTIAALGIGRLSVFETRPESLPVFSRLGSSALPRGGWATYCIMEGSSPRSGALGPSEDEGTEQADLPLGGCGSVKRGIGSFGLFADSCVQVQIPSERGAEFFLPPRTAFGVEIDPASIALTEDLRSVDGCGAQSCLVATRSLIESTVIPTWGLLEGQTESGATIRAFSSGARLRSPPLVPELDYHIEAVFDLQGASIEESITLNSGSSEAIFVLTEVLANPNGPEPKSEWIEIANLGSRAGSLAGYRLSDSSGETELPGVSLEPGGFGVIVRKDYVADPGLDEVPSASAVPIVVSEIGEGGLRNDGEIVSLRDPGGLLVSQIPPLKASPGKSWTRIDPFSPDVPESFVLREPTPGEAEGVAK